jgi:hypothetical protein
VTLSPAVRPLLTPALLVGGYVILVSLTKDLQNIWPLQLGVTNWRFGAAGFLLGSGAVPVLGLALMLVAAVLSESRGVTRGVGFLGVALGVVVAVLVALFFVDSRSVLATAAGGASADVVSGAVRRTLALGIATAPAYLILVVAGLRAAARISDDAGQAAPGVVVGSRAR